MSKPIPRWLIFLAVVVTGGTTFWAMSATNLRGPQTSWGQAQGAVEQVWADPQSGQAVAQAQATPLTGAAAAGPELSAARPVARLPGVPLILFGQRRPHGDRGPCTACHGVLTGDGTPVPTIFSFSSMPHAFRGNCTNCHEITIGRGITGSPVAATMLVPDPAAQQQQMVPQQMVPQQMVPQQMLAPQQMVPQQMVPQQMVPQQMLVPQQMVPQQMVPQQMLAPQPMVPQAMNAQPMMQPQMMGRPPPNDADWRGMEVRTGAQGVVVTNAEGTAARSGLQPGDLVTSINGANIRDMTNFVDATQNGKLAQGTVIVRRGEQRLAFEMQPRVNDGQPANGVGAMPGQMAVN